MDGSGKSREAHKTALITYAVMFALGASLSLLLFFGPGELPDVGTGAIYVAAPALAVVGAVRLASIFHRAADLSARHGP